MTETNAITKFIVNFIDYHGHFASRIQSQGQYVQSKSRWIKSKVKRGIGDIIACINGDFVMIEVKYGSDKQSDVQKLVQKQVTDAGGKYLIVKTIEDFIKFYESNYRNRNSQKIRNNK